MANERDVSAPARIDEELVCVDSLRHVLVSRCECKTIQIERVENDPPDFNVAIDGEVFPTEVTSITTGQQYHAHCRGFAEAIDRAARTQGLLSGNYAVSVSREPTIPRLQSSQGQKLLQAALDYVVATSHMPSAEEFDLAKSHAGTIRIVKLSSVGSLVGLIRMPAAMWEGEVQDEVGKLIQEKVDDKKKKLAKVGIAAHSALLLLYGAFALADAEDALHAMANVSGYDWFHSVFWAASFADRENTTYPTQPGREGLFLYSANSRWHRVGTVAQGT